MQIEVAYALAKEQTLLSLTVSVGTTVEQAIRQSGILAKYPQINLTTDKVGIFGKMTQLETILRPQDRVEIYRPLIADAKEVRKQRALKGKVMRQQKK